MGWGDTTWASTSWAVDDGGGAVAPLVAIIRKQVTVHATIDDRPVLLEDWAADAAAYWGYRTFTGKVPDTCTWAEQGAPVRLWLSDGTELWAGTLTQDPRSDKGLLHVRAEGYASVLAASKTRLLYRHDGTEGWVDRESDPHDYPSSEKYDLEHGAGLLLVRYGTADNSQSYAVGDLAGFAAWVEGAEITRYSVFAMSNVTSGAFDLRSQYATGPSGSQTTITDHPLNTAGINTTGVTFAGTVPASADLILLHVRCNTGASTPARVRLKLRQLKLYGRTTDDAFSASDVVADVGGASGFDTSLVQTNSLSVLPIDWVGGDHPGLLTYMAELTDWVWTVMGPEDPGGSPRLVFAPWETTYTAYLSHDAIAELTPMPRYNRVVIPYRALSGVKRYAEASPTEDPFPGQEVPRPFDDDDELEHPQADSTLAAAVAAAQVEWEAERKVEGRVTIGRVTGSHKEPLSALHVSPGGLLDMPDSGVGPQRIQAVSYRGTARGYDVVADVNTDFDVLRHLRDQLETRPVDRRRRKKKRRR